MSQTLGQQVVVEARPGAGSSLAAEFVIVAKLKASGFEPLGGPPVQFAKFNARESDKWNAAAQAAGLKK
jgi:hypothetical protein